VESVLTVSAYAATLPRARRSRRSPWHDTVQDIIDFAFGVATVLTNKGKAFFVDRVKGTAGTYTNPPKYIAIGVGATGAARTAEVGNTALSTEVETRTSGTESVVTTTITGDTYQVSGTVTATAERKVDEAGLFDASSTGNMFASATFNVDTLNNGDSLTLTWKTQQT
jgi:hypothetical protein